MTECQLILNEWGSKLTFSLFPIGPLSWRQLQVHYAVYIVPNSLVLYPPDSTLQVCTTGIWLEVLHINMIWYVLKELLMAQTVCQKSAKLPINRHRHIKMTSTPLPRTRFYRFVTGLCTTK